MQQTYARPTAVLPAGFSLLPLALNVSCNALLQRAPATRCIHQVHKPWFVLQASQGYNLWGQSTAKHLTVDSASTHVEPHELRRLDHALSTANLRAPLRRPNCDRLFARDSLGRSGADAKWPESAPWLS
jgi:hypothetical protein